METATVEPGLAGSPPELELGESEDSTSSGDERPCLKVAPKSKRMAPQKTSCELCKARKVKCDRAEPACSWCANHDRVCVYKGRRTRGSRAIHALELEAKVNRLDALLLALGRRVEEHIANDHAAVSQAFAASPGLGFGPQPEYSTRSEVQGSGLVGLPPSSAIPQNSSVFQGPCWQSSEAHNVPTANRTSVHALLNFSRRDPSQARYSTPAPDCSRVEGSPEAATSDLPSHDVLYTLVDLYFKHVNTWCPILDRKTTFGTFFGATSVSEADRIVLHAIVATTLRFSRDNRLSPEVKTYYHNLSQRKVKLYALEHVNIEALRALVILSLDVLGTSNGPRAWNLGALISQNVKQLGLLTESKVYLSSGTSDLSNVNSSRGVALEQPDSWIEDEGRRRVCWMAYLLDRYATVGTPGFDFMLNDHEMNRHLPCSYDLFSKNVPVETRPSPKWPLDGPDSLVPNLDRRENLGSFSYHCEILCIISRIHQFLKMPLDVLSGTAIHAWQTRYRSLDAALNTWLQSLPGEYYRVSAMCHSDPASRVANWFMLHSVFVTAVVRLHSAAAYPAIPTFFNSPPSHFTPSYHAMQRCLAAVDSLCNITRDVHEANGLDLFGPPFAFSLWVAARLLLVHAATMGGTLDPKIDFFIEMLAHLGTFWEVAGNYSKVLSRVVQKAREGRMSFGTMRRCAYDLVTMTSSMRQSSLESMSTRVTSLDELDYIDVFDFFNVPRVFHQGIGMSQGVGCPTGGTIVDFATPNPETDWLGFGT